MQAVKDMRAGRDLFARKAHTEAAQAFERAINRCNTNFTSYLCNAINAIALQQPKRAVSSALKLSELLPAWPKEDVVQEGWLKKDSGIYYKTRWFSLKSNFLYYFKTDKVRQ
jgi:hypothetical protein